MARKRRGRPISGWLVLDKPLDVTSTQAVNIARRLLDAAKAGHAGTLDPLASGVLPIAFGEATKTVPFAMERAKHYRFTIRWGEQRDTDDAEGAVVATSEVRPDEESIRAVLPRFVGEIEQVPPTYSAIKVQGERAYDLARDGAPVALAARTVRIDALRLVGLPDPDHAEFEAECGKGGYMRALARDLAVALGTVGHLSALRRVRVGPFSLDGAVTLDQLEELAAQAAAERVLLPVKAPLDDIPAVALTEPEAHRLRSGQAVALLRRSDRDRLARLNAEQTAGEPVVLAVVGERPVALVRLEGAELRPVRVLNL